MRRANRRRRPPPGRPRGARVQLVGCAKPNVQLVGGANVVGGPGACPNDVCLSVWSAPESNIPLPGPRKNLKNQKKTKTSKTINSVTPLNRLKTF